MAYENLVVEREDNIGIIALNRPPANPINLGVIDELDAVLTEWELDKAVRAIIITGAGEKGFSAGFDDFQQRRLVAHPNTTNALHRNTDSGFFDCLL